MARYALWDKVSDIYTPGVDASTGKAVWTADDYIMYKAPWAGQDNVRIVVSGGNINGAMFMDYDSLIEMAVKQGFTYDEEATEDEVLAALEEYEDSVAEENSSTVTTNERIAAALEYLAISSMEDEETEETDTTTSDDSTTEE